MRILFMGTPDIAADCLKALYEAGHDICGESMGSTPLASIVRPAVNHAAGPSAMRT